MSLVFRQKRSFSKFENNVNEPEPEPVKRVAVAVPVPEKDAGKPNAWYERFRAVAAVHRWVT